jgi:hypothetical protein
MFLWGECSCSDSSHHLTGTRKLLLLGEIVNISAFLGIVTGEKLYSPFVVAPNHTLVLTPAESTAMPLMPLVASM